MHIDNGTLDVLKTWKQTTQCGAGDDWIFASPVKIGRLPVSYAGVWQALRKAAAKAGVGHTSSHTSPPSQDLVGCGRTIGVHQKLMRHADIRTHDECLWNCGEG
jgi:integrase